MKTSIDLGSNTIRICQMDESFNIIKTAEKIVATAKNLKRGGNLDFGAKERIKSALVEFKALNFDLKNSTAVATEAFRMAKDGIEFLKEIKNEFGVNFSIIDALTEAKLTQLAVKNRLNLLNIEYKNAIFIDLGGASSEISFQNSFESFKFGIITFLNEYKNINEMTKNAEFVVQNARNFIDKFDSDKIVLTSSVPTTLIALKLGLTYENYDTKRINGEILSFDEMLNLKDKIIKMSQSQSFLKLGKNRKMPIIAGIILLEILLKNCANLPFFVIDDGLREGILLANFKA